MADSVQITQQIVGPYMDTSVPPSKLKAGVFSRLSGVDGRYSGGLRNFYGMSPVVDIGADILTTLAARGGIKGFRCVSFKKRGTSTVYQGFLVLWDKNSNTAQMVLTLVYTDDNWATNDTLDVFTGADGLTSASQWDCASHEDFLLVTVSGVGCRTVFWRSSLEVVDSGPGVFAAELLEMTVNGSGRDNTEAHYLAGDGTYQVAFRFYDSVRGVYSALSLPKTVTLNHKGLSKATGVLYSNSSGGDAGKFVDGDVITINGRTYEANDTNDSSDVNIGTVAGLTVTQQLQKFVDAVNGDASASVYAYLGSSAVTLTARVAGSGGNLITLAKSEVAPNTNDFSVSGAVLSGGGAVLETAETNCQLIVEFPKDGATWGTDTFEWDEFSAMFDTVEVFRSINLGSASSGAILYLEQSIPMPTSSALWDAATVTLGTVLDEALTYYTQYDPTTDVVKNPPAGSTIGIYSGVTFLNSAPDDNDGLDTAHSSLIQDSVEYFSTYNVRTGTKKQGRPIRYLPAGDVLILLAENSVTHIQKNTSDGSLSYVVFHYNRGLVAKMAAHTVGNSVLYLTNNGLHMLNSNDMNIGRMQTADRLLLDEWSQDLSEVTSGYDSRMDASFFLNPNTGEVLQVYHSSQSISLLEEAWFAYVDEGLDSDGKAQRVFFVTENGRVVTPDYNRGGSGTMLGLPEGYDYTTAHTKTTYSAPYNKFYVEGSTLLNLGDTLVGATVTILQPGIDVFTSRISSVSVEGGYLQLEEAMSVMPSKGVLGVISAVPFKARFSPIRYVGEQQVIDDFQRLVLNGVLAKFSGIQRFTEQEPTRIRVDAYRQGTFVRGQRFDGKDNGGMLMSEIPAETATEICVDGIDVEPLITIVDTGYSFDLTAVSVSVTLGNSRKIK